MRSALLVLAVAVAGNQAHGKAAAPQREIVISNESLVVSGDRLPGQVEKLREQFERTVGWPPGSLSIRTFLDPVDALAYVRKARPAFAILPLHQFVQGRTELGLVPIGRAVGLEGAKPAFWIISRKDKFNYEHIERKPGLRLAGRELDDMRWLSNVIFETNLPRSPDRFFKQLVPTKTASEAVGKLRTNDADVALVYEIEFGKRAEELQPGSDIVRVYASGPMPPPPVLATKWARAVDRKKLTAALSNLCAGEAGEQTCARLAIWHVEAGKAQSYDVLIEKYEGRPLK